MTPTNLPLQPSTPATPAAGSVATAAEQSQTTDFLVMLGQLVAASVQRSGTAVAPTSKAPAMILDGVEKKEEVDPEAFVAMFSLAMPPQMQAQPLPITGDLPVEQALQRLPGMEIAAAAAEAPAQNILQEVARQVTDAKALTDFAVDELTQSVDVQQAPDSTQAPNAPFQLQQPQTQATNPHVHSAISRPVHASVGSAAWADEIGTRVVMMTEAGNRTASLKLSPEHLGPLEINITVRDEKASVWFGAAHADTRAAIETALPRLREMFEAQGLSLADAGVFREPPREQAVVKTNAMGAEQGDAPDEGATVTTHARLGLVDAYA
jgi:flagellar hook-length control protein FliK